MGKQIPLSLRGRVSDPERMKTARRLSGYTKKQICGFMGWELSMLNQVESGVLYSYAETPDMEKFCKIYRTTPGFLLGRPVKLHPKAESLLKKIEDVGLQEGLRYHLLLGARV